MKETRRDEVGTGQFPSLLSELIKSDTFKTILSGKSDSYSAPVDEAIHYLANCSNPSHQILINEIERACLHDVETLDLLEWITVINALHYCALYYLNIGSTDKALSLALQTVAYTDCAENTYLSRRAHSLVGSAYMEICEFDQAFKHAHLAYEICIRANDTLGAFMVLGNTVAILESIGLLREAQELCLRLAADEPFGDEKLDCLHLSNASNGMRISYLLKDINAANKFYKVAKRSAQNKSAFATEINIAHYDAARIVYLAHRGNVKEAEEIAGAALRVTDVTKNIKAQVLIACAQAECSLLSRDIEKILKAQQHAETLIDDSREVAHQYEELLCVLLRISEFLNNVSKVVYKKQENSTIEYSKLLKVHSFGFKHLKFFSRHIEQNKTSEISDLVLENPSYEIPLWIKTISEKLTSKSRVAVDIVDDKRVVARSQPHDISAILRRSKLGGASQMFSTAENWAIGIESNFGSNGYNCLRVGWLAGRISEEMGFVSDAAQRVERACRLRDLGKVVLLVAPSCHGKLKAFGRFSLLCRHTVVGASLLALCDDEILHLAATIASTHHEWWNGCGYPVGLSGNHIPLEARICAVADSVVLLVHPDQGAKPWPMAAAVRQVLTLSGVQFDPEVCDALTKAMDRKNDNCIVDKAHQIRFSNELVTN